MSWGDVVYYDDSSPTRLRWKVPILWGRSYNKVKHAIGDVAGSLRGGHYPKVQHETEGGSLCHFVVWELHGYNLKDGEEIDHIDGDIFNNSIANLRAVSRAVNCRNRPKRTDNLSGVTGVYLEDYGYARWVALWTPPQARQRKKSFAVSKYGDKAFQLAVDYRTARMEELNAQGAGYTERHGI